MLTHVRAWLNAVNVVNVIVTFVIFGGPGFIGFTSILSCALILISIFIENKTYMLIFEGSVLLPALFIWLKSLYVSIICAIKIETKSAGTKEQ
jgi:hypothetical protein